VDRPLWEEAWWSCSCNGAVIQPKYGAIIQYAATICVRNRTKLMPSNSFGSLSGESFD